MAVEAERRVLRIHRRGTCRKLNGIAGQKDPNMKEFVVYVPKNASTPQNDAHTWPRLHPPSKPTATKRLMQIAMQHCANGAEESC